MMFERHRLGVENDLDVNVLERPPHVVGDVEHVSLDRALENVVQATVSHQNHSLLCS